MQEEEKELELKWQRLLYKLKPTFKRKPNLQSILFLIGIQELGQLDRSFTKEEKEDLMHIATCKLLSFEGFFQYTGVDEEGWPHYDRTHIELPGTLSEQEILLKKQIINYIQND